jgi:hypothetical protein
MCAWSEGRRRGEREEGSGGERRKGGRSVREGRGGTGRAPSCLHDRRVRHRQAVGMKLMMVVPAQSVCTSLHVRMRMCVCAYLAPSAAFAHSSCTLPYRRVVV